MNQIRLYDVVPHVFANRTEWTSEIWKQNVCFEKGKLYLIEANSGTGKSTLCSYLLGYRNDYSGKITFDDRDARSFRVKDWVEHRQKHVAMLFQELRLFPELTALENVFIKNKITNRVSKEKIEGWFDRLGISEKKNVRLGLMSFGQQQRVAMMRALAEPFDFILVDEPISHLDDTNSHIMGEILMEEAKQQNAGVIVTSIGKRMDLNYDKILKL